MIIQRNSTSSSEEVPISLLNAPGHFTFGEDRYFSLSTEAFRAKRFGGFGEAPKGNEPKSNGGRPL